MPATKYKIFQKGAPVGTGASGSIYVAVSGIAKPNTTKYLLVNELICAYLAKAILLQTPTGFLIDHEGTTYYVSLNFNLSGESLPPADASAIVASHPELSWGITLFDSWIMNNDRHNQNIAHDATSGEIQIFDHSHALFGSGNDNITDYLAARQDALAIGGHCLAAHITSLNGLQKWFDRIIAVPDFYIEEVIGSCIRLGLSQESTTFAATFLNNRRRNLMNIITNNQQAFPNVPQQEWTTLNH